MTSLNFAINEEKYNELINDPLFQIILKKELEGLDPDSGILYENIITKAYDDLVNASYALYKHVYLD